MANPLKGYLGSAYSGANKVAEITSWDITYDPGITPITAFGDSYAKNMYTLISVSGNIAGNTDISDTNGQEALINQFVSGGTPAAVWLYLYVSGSKGYYGEALLTPTRSAAAGAGVQSVSFSFVGHDTWYKKD